MLRSLLFVLLPMLADAATGQTALDHAKKLRSNESADRIRAANELGKLGAGAAASANALATALGDPVSEVRNAAADALGKIGKPAVGHVNKALADRDRQIAAVRAAGELGPLAADLVPAIIKCLRVDGPDVSEAVNKAIVGIGEQALPHVIEGLKDNAINLRLCGALQAMGPSAKSAAPALMQLLAKRGVRGREGAADALGAIGDPQAVPGLIEVVDEALAKVDSLLYGAGEKSLRALGRIKAKPELVVPLCVRVLGSPRRDVEAAGLQGRALETLERLDARQPEALDALRAFVASDPGKHKEAAARLLKKLGG
ncbi:MAG TPA: HEAT repeat domain-containing protein [Planctomycetota bacterium]